MKPLIVFLALLFLIGIFSSTIVSAEQPTQQYAKIFLNPFYRVSMNSNTNYTYALQIFTPDKIGQVYSAIIAVDIYLTPTVNYDLWVDGEACNNPRFTVSTTYAGASQGRLYFDCSNVITKEGIYTITIKADKNSGASVVWLDLTYSNQPKGRLTLHGTEYTYGQIGKVWLQLLDNDGDEVNNGVCYLDIYTPTGEYYLEDGTMTNALQDGIYYYDLTIPIEQGVYPAIAKCYYEASQNIRYAQSYVLNVGVLESGTIANTWVQDLVWLRLKTVNTPGGRVNVTFNWSGDFYNNCGNVSEDLLTSVTILWNGKWETNTVNHDVYLYVYNYTSSSWIMLPNKIVGGLGGSAQTITNSIQTNNITHSLGITATQPLLVTAENTVNTEKDKKFYTDYLYASCDQLAFPEWQEVKGSSELHVTSDKLYIASLTSGQLTNETFHESFTLEYLVSSGTSTLREDVQIELETWKNAFPCQYLKEVYIYNDTSSSWYNVSFVTYLSSDNTCGVRFKLNLEKGKNYPVKIISENFWKSEYISKYERLTFQETNLDIGCINYQMAKGYPNYTLPLDYPSLDINDSLYRMCYMYKDWKFDWITESSAFYNLLNINYNFTEEEMTTLEGYYYHTINTADEILDMGNGIYYGWLLGNAYSQAILSDPYPPTNPEYTLYFANISASYLNYQAIVGVPANTWNYASRNLTYYEQIDLTNYTLISLLINSSISSIPSPINFTQIAEYVWISPSRNLTYTADVTDYNNIWIGIWNYTTRNLTYYPAQVDLTNYQMIQEMTWNATDRNLTYYQDVTDYLLIQALVWNATTRNLTYYPAQVDLTNYSEIWIGVWNYTTRNLTYYPMQLDLTNYTLISELINSSIANIQVTITAVSIESIWNYTNRNLTYYPAQLDLTNYTLISQLVWDYASRNLTYTPDMTNYLLIQQLVWNATDRNLTYYLPTDISGIAEAVWNFSNRNLTYYNLGNNLSASDVWNYISRNLTYYEQIDLTNYSLITENIWSYNNRTLTYYEINNISASDIWNYVNRSLTQNISEEVWLYYNKTLTYYPDTTNYSLIGDTVWQYVNRSLTENIALEVWTFSSRNLTQNVSADVWTFYNRTLTYYPDVTNYTLITENIWNYANRSLTASVTVDLASIVEAVWNATDRNLTFYPTQLDLTNYTLISELVWSYVDRNLTYTPDMTNYLLIQGLVWNATDRNLTYYLPTDLVGVANAVWNFSDRNLTYYDLGNNLSATDVWEFVSRNLTYYEHLDMTNYSLITENIWSYNNRTLTYYFTNITPEDIWSYANRSLTQNISEEVWLYYNRSLTYYPDVTNYTQIGDVIWAYANRSLTQDLPLEIWTYSSRNLTQNISFEVWTYYNKTLDYYPDVTNYSLISEGVWNYVDRNLTFYPTQLDLTNYTLISDMVWAYTNRSLTAPVVVDLDSIAASVWNYTYRNLTYIDFVSIALNVWNATDRNLTYYQDTSNYTLNAEQVWNYVNRNLTYQDFSTVASLVWEYTNRNLTYYEDVTNYLTAAQTVWNYTNRELTYIDFATQAAYVWNATNRNLTYYQDTTNYALIQEMVWNATTRTLTQLNLTVNVNTTAIADAVWNSVNRTLTDYNQSDLTDYNLIQTMVWNATIRTLTDFNITVNATINDTAIASAVWGFTNKTVDFATTGNTDNVSIVENIKDIGQTYVGGTEYIYGDAGKIVIRLVRGTGALAEIELGATCSVSIAYPNSSSYITNASMAELGNGVYYYDFTIPEVLGIYPYYTDCNISDRFYYGLDDFHVYETNYSSVPGIVWNYTPGRNLTYYQIANLTNVTVNVNNSAVAEGVWAYNGTINNNILSQIAEYTWTVFDTIHDFISGIWSAPSRTLTSNCLYLEYGYYNKDLPMLSNINCD